MQNSVSFADVEVNRKLGYYLRHLYPFGYPPFIQAFERSYSKNYWLINALSHASNLVVHFYKFDPSSLKQWEDTTCFNDLDQALNEQLFHFSLQWNCGLYINLVFFFRSITDEGFIPHSG